MGSHLASPRGAAEVALYLFIALLMHLAVYLVPRASPSQWLQGTIRRVRPCTLLRTEPCGEAARRRGSGPKMGAKGMQASHWQFPSPWRPEGARRRTQDAPQIVGGAADGRLSQMRLATAAGMVLELKPSRPFSPKRFGTCGSGSARAVRQCMYVPSWD